MATQQSIEEWTRSRFNLHGIDDLRQPEPSKTDLGRNCAPILQFKIRKRNPLEECWGRFPYQCLLSR